MKLGNFNKMKDGHFQGRLETLTISQEITFVPVPDKDSEKSPDYQIMHSGTGFEIGAGWNHISKDDNPYIKVKIDDPSLAYTLWGALTETDGAEYALHWSRPNGKSGKSSIARKTL